MKIIPAEEARKLSSEGSTLEMMRDLAVVGVNDAIKAATKENKFSTEIFLDFRVSAFIVKELTEAGYRVSGFDKLIIKWREAMNPKGSDGLVTK